MPKIFIYILAILWLAPLTLALAESGAQKPKILDLADGLAEEQSFLKIQLAFELYKQAPRLHPDSYQAQWKAARAFYFAGTIAERSRPKDWKDLCAEYG
ncbi:MAG: hypothetical protein ACOC43_10600, partial [Desulfohalobiaceae bacterium]